MGWFQDRWLVVFVDGFSCGQHLLVGALGVTADGTKIPLAVVEGTTENATLCTRLTANLRDRGLDASKGLLFVVDGSKALSKAIRAVWGGKALIGRCRLHKERGVLDHLPEAEHDWVRRKLRAAWQLADADAAKRDLEALARALARKHPGAAGALREGLDETLTVTRLGITGSLLRTVFSTNPVESMIEIVRDHAANVKRWRDGTMAAAVSRRRDGGRPHPVPTGQGLPAAPPARRRARGRNRRRTRHPRPSCHSIVT